MSLATADAVKAPADDAIEVLLTLTPTDYAEMGQDLVEARQRLGLPASTPNDDVIRKAVYQVAHPG